MKRRKLMDFQTYFPIWKQLTPLQQNRILGSLASKKVAKGTVLHNGSADCTGLLLVRSKPAPRVHPLGQGPGDHHLPAI